MSDLSLLLEELRKVDEETWNAIYIHIMRIRGIMPEDDEGQDIIQGCIQRACIPYPPGEMIANKSADTPAAAILAAYIAAVRASSG